MLVDDSCCSFTGFEIYKARKQADFVIRIERSPQHIGKRIQIVADFDLLRLAVKARDRIAVALIGVDKMTLARDRLCIFIEETQCGTAVSVVALQNGELIGEIVLRTRLAGNKADIWWLRQHEKVLNLPFKEGIRRADRDNAIDVYISEDYEDVIGDNVWQNTFTEQPVPLTREEKRAWLDKMTGVSLGSDAFFPFGDNIERAHRSGVCYIAQPGGSIRDDNVIETCNKYDIAMAFTGIRLFHH